MKHNKKVVVTGMGVVSPIGNNVEQFEESLFKGVSGAGPLTRFNPGSLTTRFVSEVKNLPNTYRDVKVGFGLKASKEAIESSFRSIDLLNSYRNNSNKKFGLSIGIGLELFSMDDLVEYYLKDFNPDWIKTQSWDFLNSPSEVTAHLLSALYGCSVYPEIAISACAASTDAIGVAFERIASGEWDIVLTGGTDSMINPMGLGGFCKIGALSTLNESPQTASRPFDEKRNGFVLGEGAGFLVLESLEAAQQRGATIFGEILGYGNSLDAYSVSDPHPEGKGAREAMERALKCSGIDRNQISAVSVHGTSTLKNDPAESAALRSFLGDRWSETPAFATKSMIGHLISAAGAVETVASFLSFKKQMIHPTINTLKIANDCSINLILNEAKPHQLNYILKNSFGFGGQNACLILGRK